MTVLNDLVAATLDPARGYMWLGEADYAPLVEAGYAEVNATVPNAPVEGQIATRATPAGITAVQNQGVPASSGFGAAPQNIASVDPVTASSTPKFTFVSGFQPPARKPRGAVAGAGASEKYPFGELKAPTKREDGSLDYTGAVIFVPSNTHTKGDKKGQLRTAEEMAFSLVSACSAANRRYATVVGEETGKDGKQRKKYEYSRDFKTAPGEQNGQPGAYIYRAK
jgi:hypothetical protein